MEASKAANASLPCACLCNWPLDSSSRSRPAAFLNFLALPMCAPILDRAPASCGSGAADAASSVSQRWSAELVKAHVIYKSDSRVGQFSGRGGGRALQQASHRDPVVEMVEEAEVYSDPLQQQNDSTEQGEQICIEHHARCVMHSTDTCVKTGSFRSRLHESTGHQVTGVPALTNITPPPPPPFLQAKG